jgi:carboxyl-terminal processing protease
MNEYPTQKRWPKVIGGLVLLALGIFIGRYVVPAGVAIQTPLEFVAVENGQRQLVFPTFWEAWDIVHEKFIGEIDDKKLFYGAVSGLVRATGDPYTVFADPEETKQFEENIGGSFSGIGVEIGMRDGHVTVIAPLTGSPADLAGIKTGDIVVAIDDKPISPEETLDEVVSRIRGERGKPVSLTVIHQGEDEPVEITVVRDTIEIESVRSTIENNIAVIKISSFNGDTAERFTQAAHEAARARVQGVIVDVRNNPGGFLESSVEIASVFLKQRTLVVSEKGDQDKEYYSKTAPILSNIPVVVVVNGGSASASEILAGALHDQRQSQIVGEKTFGKGSVQEFKKLSDGSSIRVTVAKWYTPSGRSIDDHGIDPNIVVTDDPATPEDEQLNRAKETLQSQINLTRN